MPTEPERLKASGLDWVSSMASDDSMDRESLSSRTVAQLREICKNRGLMVSGKKSDLVDRILDDAGVASEPEEHVEPEQGDQSWTEDALVMEDEDEDTRERVEEVLSKLKVDVVEAEVVEAKVVQDGSRKDDESPEPVILGEDDQPSIVITMPTLSSLGERWKAVTAVVMVVILVGAATTVFLQRNSGFTTSKLQFGDSMDFQVIDSEVSIVGEEMLGLVRDSTGDILDRVCGELSVEMSGTGRVSVTDGFESGAVPTTDSLGRSGFLTVEKNIGMDLDADFGGRSWRDDTNSECGVLTGTFPDNDLVIDSTSWVELREREVKRTDTSISFTDAYSETTNLRAVTYDPEGIGGLGALFPILAFPLTPIELNDFFGEAEIKDGARSTDPELNWNSDWKWQVKKEVRDPDHGLVFPVELEHEDIGRCYGHARLSLLLKQGSPWPVYQNAEILLDKDLETGECDFLISTISDEVLPDGTLSIRMTFSRSSSTSGSEDIGWGMDYLGRPTDGEDRPGSSTKRKWIDSMWDESDIRQFDMEEALSCLKANHPSNKATQALESGGYIWNAKWSTNNGEPAWNLSLVDDDDESGWLVLRRSPEGCDIESSGNNDRGEVTWNSDSIPETQTISLLEGRILTQERYPDISQHIKSGNSWHLDAEVGYRLSVTEDNEFLSLLPGDLGDGKVTMLATREWQTGGRQSSLELAMDAETGEMALWYMIDSPSG